VYTVPDDVWLGGVYGGTGGGAYGLGAGALIGA